MNKILLGTVVVTIVIGSIFFIVKKDTPSTSETPLGPGPIVALGDSLVYGYGSTPGNDFVSVLSNKIGKPIINMGVSGNTTADGLARVDSVLALKTSVVLVLVGGNDYLRRVPITETFQNLDTIIQKLQANGVVVVLLGIQGGVVADPFKTEFQALAKRYGAPYVPNMLSGLVGNQTYMADAIHPNDAGYKKIAEKILPTLEAVLR